MEKETVLVGMSGGVDSSVAAYLLKKDGFHVIGVTMHIWSGEAAPHAAPRSGCYGPGEIQDTRDAEQTCKKLGIPHFIIDLSDDYEKAVIENFSSEYRHGHTPNPCVLCNPIIKFGALLEKSKTLGIEFEHFATGHYARAVFDETNQRYHLKKGVDRKKDQSYFLYRLNQSQLKQTLFPLGDLKKEQVKTIAHEIGLKKIAEKPESQDFMDGGDYQSIFGKTESKAGTVIDLQGKVLGEHPGIQYFTIGQRKGVLGGGISQRMYVLKIDPLSNCITVGPKEYLAVDKLTAGNLNWIAFKEPQGTFMAHARLRSSQKESPCTITPIHENQIKVHFQESQYFATPGQSIVFYQDELVLGGGIMQSVHAVHERNE
jgi:tRNA-specific 2-thiouridylase